MPNRRTIEVPVESLRKGLYVSGLDRPWLGSPFPFQGFEIRSDAELEQLREVCRTVFVDLSPAEADELLSAPRPAPARALPRESGGAGQLKALSGNPAAFVGSVPEKDPEPLAAELKTAKGLYANARERVDRVLDRLRRGGGLELEVVETVVDSMIDSVFRNRDAMSWLARLKDKDDYLYSHSLSSSVWALAFGRHLGFERELLRSVGVGAMLLDVGKTKLPVELLQKAAAPDEPEWQLLRSHVELGTGILEQDSNVTPLMKEMIRTHHERIDGKGYPGALKGDAIPVLGRIGAIVDSYDAMISSRPYGQTRSAFDAVRELKQVSGTQLDKSLVELFIQAVGVFPTGSLVELNTGEVAVVVSQSRFRRLRPQVMVVLDAGKQVLAQFNLIDLALRPQGESGDEGNLWIERGLPPGSYGIDPQDFFL